MPCPPGVRDDESVPLADPRNPKDHFSGSTLDPAWSVLGTGTYSLIDGDLEFVTQKGDFIPGMGGAVQHLFTVTPDAALTEWSAIARVRYNTPTLNYQQVVVLAYTDSRDYAKISYNHGSGGTMMTYLAEYSGHYVEQGPGPKPAETDYFWLRLDREQNNYSSYISHDLSTDPDLVHWTYIGGSYAGLGASPMAGIAGFNGPTTSGVLAEYDYFRLSSPIPEPGTIALLAFGLGATILRRRRVL